MTRHDPVPVAHRDLRTGRLTATTLEVRDMPETDPNAPEWIGGATESRRERYARGYGHRYDRNATTTELAARVRADIKAALKDGTLPMGLKVSVRTSYFAGGSSIDVKVRAVPDGFRIMNPARLAWAAKHPYDLPPLSVGGHYSEEAQKTLDVLKGLLDAYNRDGSDVQSDYWDVRFYGDVSFDWRLMRAEEQAFMAGRQDA